MKEYQGSIDEQTITVHPDREICKARLTAVMFERVVSELLAVKLTWQDNSLQGVEHNVFVRALATCWAGFIGTDEILRAPELEVCRNLLALEYFRSLGSR